MTPHGTHLAGAPLSAVPALSATWFAMMAVMMAPVAWPWIAAFHRIDGRRHGHRRGAATAGFISGYALAWLLYSIAAALLQWLIAQRLPGNGDVLPTAASAGVLVGAGLVQFTSLKRACLSHCRTPFSFLLARWDNGPAPAWRLGLGHGLFCVGCCWAMMATMLAVGMTNVWWMIALAVATLAEQIARHGDRVRVAIGVVLITAGLFAAV